MTFTNDMLLGMKREKEMYRERMRKGREWWSFGEKWGTWILFLPGIHSRLWISGLDSLISSPCHLFCMWWLSTWLFLLWEGKRMYLFNARYTVIFITGIYCVLFIFHVFSWRKLGLQGLVLAFNSTEPNTPGSSVTVICAPKCLHSLSETCTSLSHPELFSY